MLASLPAEAFAGNGIETGAALETGPIDLHAAVDEVDALTRGTPPTSEPTSEPSAYDSTPLCADAAKRMREHRRQCDAWEARLAHIDAQAARVLDARAAYEAHAASAAGPEPTNGAQTRAKACDVLLGRLAMSAHAAADVHREALKDLHRAGSELEATGDGADGKGGNSLLENFFNSIFSKTTDKDEKAEATHQKEEEETPKQRMLGQLEGDETIEDAEKDAKDNNVAMLLTKLQQRADETVARANGRRLLYTELTYTMKETENAAISLMQAKETTDCIYGEYEVSATSKNICNAVLQGNAEVLSGFVEEKERSKREQKKEQQKEENDENVLQRAPCKSKYEDEAPTDWDKQISDLPKELADAVKSVSSATQKTSLLHLAALTANKDVIESAKDLSDISVDERDGYNQTPLLMLLRSCPILSDWYTNVFNKSTVFRSWTCATSSDLYKKDLQKACVYLVQESTDKTRAILDTSTANLPQYRAVMGQEFSHTAINIAIVNELDDVVGAIMNGLDEYSKKLQEPLESAFRLLVDLEVASRNTPSQDGTFVEKIHNSTSNFLSNKNGKIANGFRTNASTQISELVIYAVDNNLFGLLSMMMRWFWMPQILTLRDLLKEEDEPVSEKLQLEETNETFPEEASIYGLCVIRKRLDLAEKLLTTFIFRLKPLKDDIDVLCQFASDAVFTKSIITMLVGAKYTLDNAFVSLSKNRRLKSNEIQEIAGHLMDLASTNTGSILTLDTINIVDLKEETDDSEEVRTTKSLIRTTIKQKLKLSTPPSTTETSDASLETGEKKGS